jgi:hypothetical protein
MIKNGLIQFLAVLYNSIDFHAICVIKVQWHNDYKYKLIGDIIQNKFIYFSYFMCLNEDTIDTNSNSWIFFKCVNHSMLFVS